MGRRVEGRLLVGRAPIVDVSKLKQDMKRLVLIWIILALVVLTARGERRALLIGNAEYPKPWDLDTPMNDVRELERALESLGFETVRRTNVGDRVAMEETVLDFRRELEAGDLALVFFAGHGIEIEGINYLVPTGIDLASFRDPGEAAILARRRCLDAGFITDALERSPASLKVLVLDCCRENPTKTRGLSNGGLAQMNPPEGTLIAFATAPGKDAVDSLNGRNSPYSAALAAALLRRPEQGVELIDLFRQVGREVGAQLKQRPFVEQQRPFLNFDTTMPEYYLIAPKGGISRPEEPRLSANEPYTNSLGIRFVPVRGVDALFSVWETRRRDYEAYADSEVGVDDFWRNADYLGEPVGHGSDHPVVGVSWDDAQRFCEWLTAKERAAGRIGPRDRYRLPTDREWSAAVGLPYENGSTPKDRHGVNQRHFPWGEASWGEAFPAVGNYASSISSNDGYATTAPVGSFEANADGLHDLGGNVWEWCEDWHSDDRESRVLRGGSWAYEGALTSLSSFRVAFEPTSRRMNFGFRCVLAVGGSSGPSVSEE